MVEDNPVSKAVNKVFTLARLEPPLNDIVDVHGVMIFPSLASFSMAPPGIAKLTQEEVSGYLEAFGFASAVGKLKGPALKQLLMWKLVEEAFVVHHTTAPAPAEYKRSVELTAA